jgi:hypothetical protein
MQKNILRPDIELLWLGTVDQGRQLEFNTVIEGVSWPLATIVADEQDESLWFEVYVDGRTVQIPLALVQEALDAAPDGVHSEAWYEASGIYDEGQSAAARAFAKREDSDAP